MRMLPLITLKRIRGNGILPGVCSVICGIFLQSAVLAEDFSDPFDKNNLEDNYEIVVHAGDAEWDVVDGHLLQASATNANDSGWFRPKDVIIDAPGAGVSWNMRLDVVPKQWDNGWDGQDVGIQLQSAKNDDNNSIKLSVKWGVLFLTAKVHGKFTDRIRVGYANLASPKFITTVAGDTLTLKYERWSSGSATYTMLHNERQLVAYKQLGNPKVRLQLPFKEFKSNTILRYPVLAYWAPTKWRGTIDRLWTEGVAQAVSPSGKLATSWGETKVQ